MFIYKITNIVNNKIYIGKTIKSIRARFNHHVGRALRHERISRLCSAIRKHGKDSFIVEQIEVCSTVEELDSREIYWISRLNSTDPDIGYNMTEGGDGGYSINTAGVDKLIGFAKSRAGRTYEEIYGLEKAASILKAKSDSMCGIHAGRIISEETSKKISESLIKKYKDPEYKSKITKANQKIAKNRIGKKRPNLHSEETKKLLSDFRRGKTYEEIYGVDKAQSLKDEISIRFSNENNPLWKDIPIDEVIRDFIVNPHVKTDELAKKYKCSRPTFIKKFRAKTNISNLQHFRFEKSTEEIRAFFEALL